MLRSVVSISLTETRAATTKFSRLVVLLNLPEPCTHGEARLFDPDGKIRKTLCQDRYLKYINARHDILFLEKMKHEFYNTFGPNESTE
jgi:hypothetical protein